jgi:dCTP deaminase
VILCDREIEGYCLKGMVSPFDPKLLNAASLDIRLGPTVLRESSDAGWVEHDIRENPPWFLVPGEFILASSLETFCIPDNLAAQFCLKSSRAREGYEHSLAGWCDPGWSNSVLTLEIKNNSRWFKLPLTYGMPIGQMVFLRLSQRPSVLYSQKGHYNGDSKTQKSRFDPRFGSENLLAQRDVKTDSLIFASSQRNSNHAKIQD